MFEKPDVLIARKPGLRKNWRQFALLVLINAFVGAMVGLERSILPLLAEQSFGLASRTAILSFIASFGTAKAIANLLAGHWSDRFGRRRILIAGWLVGLPVPFMVIWAPSWGWVVAANVLLGINQGLAWSATVIMKIDLAGSRRRGLAMGLNEAAGYLAVSLTALAAGYVAAAWSLRPEPFYLGVGIAAAGLILSLIFAQETRQFASTEPQPQSDFGTENPPTFARIFLLTSWQDRTLFSVSQTGMINNLNDGMAWGLFPLYYAAAGLSLTQIGWLAALYPAVWGLGQLATGAMSDSIGRKPLIVGGMLIQAAGIILMLLSNTFLVLAGSMVLLGLGTAMVYPTLLAVIGDAAQPDWRATAVGIYRLWRDGGYVLGAILAGLITDLFGFSSAIVVIALLTAVSGLISAALMEETLMKQKQESGQNNFI